MHKIQVCDNNTPAFATFRYTYFTENLEHFETHWLPQAYEELQEMYQRSKAGYFANNFYGVGADADMVICDLDGKILEERVTVKEDVTLPLVNGYNCQTDIFAKKLELRVAKLQFQGQLYLVGKYRIEGGCFMTFWEQAYSKLPYYGNYSLITHYANRDEALVERYGDWKNIPAKAYEGDWAETHSWIMLEKYEETEPKKRWYQLGKNRLSQLMMDILGEAG